MDLFIDTLVWKKEKLYHVSYFNFTFEVININLSRYDMQHTTWMCCNYHNFDVNCEKIW